MATTTAPMRTVATKVIAPHSRRKSDIMRAPPAAPAPGPARAPGVRWW
jgi:hypothetical protein